MDKLPLWSDSSRIALNTKLDAFQNRLHSKNRLPYFYGIVKVLRFRLFVILKKSLLKSFLKF